MFKTALHDQHEQLKAKMVNFGGWHMPVSYSSVLAEHKAVRESCGVFDVSHMGEIFVSGPDATAFLRYVAMNEIAKLSDGLGQYTGILNEQGGFIDDLIVYRLSSSEYLICANASNVDKDFAWLQSRANNFNIELTNESNAYSQLAIQGPNAFAVVKNVLPQSAHTQLEALAYTGIMQLPAKDGTIFVARTGYTGEKGYEIYLSNQLVVPMWQQILNGPTPCQPIGLGARDTLRLEACYLLYGNDMDDTVTPLEAGVAWAVAMKREPFVGQAALLKQLEFGVPRQMRAFKMIDEAIPRHGMSVRSLDGTELGIVTSGSVLPTVGGAGGMCLLNKTAGPVGTEVAIDVRGKSKLAKLVKRPLYEARTK